MPPSWSRRLQTGCLVICSIIIAVQFAMLYAYYNTEQFRVSQEQAIVRLRAKGFIISFGYSNREGNFFSNVTIPSAAAADKAKLIAGLNDLPDLGSVLTLKFVECDIDDAIARELVQAYSKYGGYHPAQVDLRDCNASRDALAYLKEHWRGCFLTVDGIEWQLDDGMKQSS